MPRWRKAKVVRRRRFAGGREAGAKVRPRAGTLPRRRPDGQQGAQSSCRISPTWIVMALVARDVIWSSHSGFLGSSSFRRGNPADEGSIIWILDFLVEIQESSYGLRWNFLVQIFQSRLLRLTRRRGTGATILAMAEGQYGSWGRTRRLPTSASDRCRHLALSRGCCPCSPADRRCPGTLGRPFRRHRRQLGDCVHVAGGAGRGGNSQLRGPFPRRSGRKSPARPGAISSPA